MCKRTYELKRIGFSLLRPKAIIVGLAVFNFMVFYLYAKAIEGQLFCFGAPWYITPPFYRFPLMLLIAALGLFLGRLWSYLLTFVLSLGVIYWGVVNNLFMVDASALVRWMLDELGILYQISLSIILLVGCLIGITRHLRGWLSWRRAA